MARISLVISLACRRPLADVDIDSYRHALEDEAGVASVEVILSGDASESHGLSKADSLIVVPASGKNQLECLHEAVRVASGDILVVLDPSRHYAPEAPGQLVQALRHARADLAIGVPARSRDWLGWKSGLGTIGQLALGSRASDTESRIRSL